MFYIVSDTHGDFTYLAVQCKMLGLNSDDTVIITGDAGFNYHLDYRDEYKKDFVNSLGITFFCIQGNHEKRPNRDMGYFKKIWNGGTVYYQENYPNILFADDGELYEINGKTAIVLGGAYSVDKDIRLVRGMQWFADEQMNDEQKQFAADNLNKVGWKVGYVFSHTCPSSYVPSDCLLDGINQDNVDKTTEDWLEKVENAIEQYDYWYCGHFHIERVVDKVHFVYQKLQRLLV